MIRVAFLGNADWSVPTLRALDDADDVEVGLVVTNPPRPAGRGSSLTTTPVADEARARALPLLEVDGVRSGNGLQALRHLEPDALVVVAYGELLTPEVLGIPRLGSLNVHFSVLPRWRGAAPVQRAILEGDERTGVTVMLMDEGMDTGPILATVEVPIEADEDAGTLGARLAELGAPLLVETVRQLAQGSIEPRPQPTDGVTFAPKPRSDERVIDWGEDAEAIVRRVRAFAPEPGATTTFRGDPLKVLKADAVPVTHTGAPERGRLDVESRDGTPFVDVLNHTVRLLDVAPAGRRRMTGAEWARGARLTQDERLG
jgi:methionyl-tRNA formyltransferase